MSQFDRKKRAGAATKTQEDVEEASDVDHQLDELDDGKPEEQDEDDDDETDESREAADDAVLDGLDDENPELVLTRVEISTGQLALEKVGHFSHALQYLTCPFTDPEVVKKGLEQSSSPHRARGVGCYRKVQQRGSHLTRLHALEHCHRGD